MSLIHEQIIKHTSDQGKEEQEQEEAEKEADTDTPDSPSQYIDIVARPYLL